MSEVAVKRCSCGGQMLPAGQNGLWACSHCDSPCKVGVKTCSLCQRQAKSTRPE